MPTYTVKQIKQIANGGDPGKEWTRQKVRLQPAGVENAAFTDATMFCNRFTPVPKEGDTLEGTIEPPKQEGWSPEFKPVKKGGFGGGMGGPRPEDPKRMASIAMQHSQDTALRMVTWALENGLIKDTPITLEWLHGQVLLSANGLYAQVKGAQDAV